MGNTMKEMPISEQMEERAQTFAEELINNFDCEQQREILFIVSKRIEDDYRGKIADAEKAFLSIKEQLGAFKGTNLEKV